MKLLRSLTCCLLVISLAGMAGCSKKSAETDAGKDQKNKDQKNVAQNDKNKDQQDGKAANDTQEDKQKDSGNKQVAGNGTDPIASDNGDMTPVAARKPVDKKSTDGKKPAILDPPIIKTPDKKIESGSGLNRKPFGPKFETGSGVNRSITPPSFDDDK